MNYFGIGRKQLSLPTQYLTTCIQTVNIFMHSKRPGSVCAIAWNMHDDRANTSSLHRQIIIVIENHSTENSISNNSCTELLWYIINLFYAIWCVRFNVATSTHFCVSHCRFLTSLVDLCVRANWKLGGVAEVAHILKMNFSKQVYMNSHLPSSCINTRRLSTV